MGDEKANACLRNQRKSRIQLPDSSSEFKVTVQKISQNQRMVLWHHLLLSVSLNSIRSSIVKCKFKFLNMASL